MSIKLMTVIWEDGPDDISETMVLLALADHANDAGESWPSMRRLMKRCRMTDRGIQKVVKRLRAAGWLDVRVNAGPNGVNVWVVQVPERGSGGNRVRGEQGSGTPPNGVRVTPERGSGRTVKDPSEDPSGGAEAPPPTTDLDLFREDLQPEGGDKSGRKQRRAVQIGDFFPNETALKDAALQIFGSFSEASVEKAMKVAEQFVDHARDKGRTSKDWAAAWRMWVSKETQYEEERKRRRG